MDVVELAAATAPVGESLTSGPHLGKALEAFHQLCEKRGWTILDRESGREVLGVDGGLDDPRWDEVWQGMKDAVGNVGRPNVLREAREEAKKEEARYGLSKPLFERLSREGSSNYTRWYTLEDLVLILSRNIIGRHWDRFGSPADWAREAAVLWDWYGREPYEDEAYLVLRKGIEERVAHLRAALGRAIRCSTRK